MQNDTYNIRDRRKERKETKSSFQQLYWTLESLGNNFMAMLWQVHLALNVLQEGDNLDQAKKNLQDALQAGDCAKKLMRTVLNSPNHIEADRLEEHRKTWKNLDG
jgi:phage-related minor tail protein